MVMNKIDDIIFEAKLKDIRVNENRKIITYTIGIIFFSQHLAYANPSVGESNQAIEFLNNYGPPFILTVGELFKSRIPIKLHMKNL